MLCLQLNRIEYKDNDLVKNRHRVQIEKTLFIDRFLYENRVMSLKLQQHVKQLREQIKHLESSINNFTHFGGSEYDIIKVFDLMGKFFNEQGKNLEGWNPMAGLNSFHPFNNQVQKGDKAKVDQAVGVLKQF